MGKPFYIYSSEVFTLISKFITGNETAETEILPHIATTNGRLAFKALMKHYKGVILHSVDIIKADDVITSLFYSGEGKKQCGGRNSRSN